MPIKAEPFNEDLRDLLLAANIDEVIKQCDESKKIKDSKNIEYCAIAYISDGNIDKAQMLISKGLEKKQKNELKVLQEHINNFQQRYSSMINSADVNSILGLKTVAYLPTRFDYLIQNNYDKNKLEKLALDLISEKQKIMFPNTLDLYELASAQRTLATIKIKDNKLEEAHKFIELARLNIYRMKSIWVEEDIFVYSKFWRMKIRKTNFGYVFPQWLIELRAEYDNYLLRQ